MRAVRSLGLRAAAVVAAAALMLVATACGGRPQSEAVPTTPLTAGSNEKLAPSMQAFAQRLLRENGSLMTDKQRKVVESVTKSGKVSVAEYEESLSDYKQCMLSRGYKEIIFIDIGEGLKVEAGHMEGSRDRETKYRNDMGECMDLHYGTIDTIYRSQVGNTSLLLNHYEAVADCLKKADLVPSSYTGDQYRKEYNDWVMSDSNNKQWTFSYSKDNYAKANVCVFANGRLDVNPDWPKEQLW
ncbi:hypothetical protein [Bifidobacterium jacchi]|uniref:Lipoprotein n=1 Tax=Bifidobacterium jacchi TaxID=2490545 RepID=A0A5N5RMH7_9BIFI|nr:hypothetical protein [Bifidobacterium jacchi]KAB5607951.1 hypothetical protein EHS19_03230 [Bifidobacterium jacchi]